MGETAKGLDLRVAAVEVLDRIFSGHGTFEEAMSRSDHAARLDDRDRAFASAIVHAVLRRRGELEALLKMFLPKPLPKKSGNAMLILLAGAAQLRFMDVAPHAAIDVAVRQAKADSGARHFAGLINAVLRRVADGTLSGPAAGSGVRANTPSWLWRRWARTYGEDIAAAIAGAHTAEVPIDITVADRGSDWATRLAGCQLPSGSIRLGLDALPVNQLPGFADGGWWVQDVAAAMVAALCGDVSGKSVLDLCAAPGGKTMQLCAAGAMVTAVDSSGTRLKRLGENLSRQRFTAEVIESDVMDLELDRQFDCVLLDAPCSATGTIRRHPELPYIRSDEDIQELVKVQWRLLQRAASFVRPGGLFIYSTCSLEPEEGERQVKRFLERRDEFRLAAIRPGEAGIESHFVTVDGHLRTLPFMPVGSERGLDGFFAARMTRLSG